MKNKWLIGILLVAALLLLVAAKPAPEAVGLAFGELHWTRISVCEHPWYPGVFLQYYLADDCGHEVFLHGKLSQSMVGLDVWTSGIVLQNGSCTILEVSGLQVCVPPEPGG